MKRSAQVVLVVAAVLAALATMVVGTVPAGAEVPPEACATDDVAEVTDMGDVGPSLADADLEHVVVTGVGGPEVLDTTTGDRVPVPGLTLADQVIAISPDG